MDAGGFASDGALTPYSDRIVDFDESQDYKVFPKQDPRVRTLIQEKTIQGQGKHEAFLLTQTTARVFATKEVLGRAIEGGSEGSAFRSIRSCTVHALLAPQDGDRPAQYLHVFKADGQYYEVILDMTKPPTSEDSDALQFLFVCTDASTLSGAARKQYDEVMTSAKGKIKGKLRQGLTVDFTLRLEDASAGTARMIMTTWTATRLGSAEDQPPRLAATGFGRTATLQPASPRGATPPLPTKASALKILNAFFDVVRIAFVQHNIEGRGEEVDEADA